MKITWPPPQVIFVGLESNQHGHAASQEHASSRSPLTFHGVFFSWPTAATDARNTAITRENFAIFMKILLVNSPEKDTAIRRLAAHLLLPRFEDD
jgi:hypothetical protein